VWLAGRLVQLLLVVVLVVSTLFVGLRLSGDPIALLLPPSATPADVQSLRHQYGFDRSVAVQYVDFVKHIIKLDFGTSIVYRQPTLQVVFDRVPRTLLLVGAAMAVAIAVGVFAGVYLAMGRSRAIRGALELLVSAGQAVPTFVLSILLLLVFSAWLGWFPSFGFDSTRAIVLPAIALSALQMTKIARLMRALVFDVSGQDFVRTARAKGVGRAGVLFRHILPSTGIGMLTLLGVQFSILLGGAVVVETVFSWPGIGRLLVDSVSQRDYPVVQGTVFMIAVGVVIINAVIDLAYFALDPRLRGAAT
jgi:peptide/nickel transport system permease protein